MAKLEDVSVFTAEDEGYVIIKVEGITVTALLAYDEGVTSMQVFVKEDGRDEPEDEEPVADFEVQNF